MLKPEPKIRPAVFLLILFLIPNILFLLVYAMAHYYASDSFNDESLILKKEGIKVVFYLEQLDKTHAGNNYQNIADDLTKVLKNSKAGEFISKICSEKQCDYTIYGAEADRLRQVVIPYLKKYPKTSGNMYMIYDLRNMKEQVKNDLY